MLATDIYNCLINFYESDNVRTLLLDGVWGSGKTYNVEKFIKENNKAIYVSLHGAKNENDMICLFKDNLDSKCIKKTNDNYRIIEPFEENDITENIIFFDDLERKNFSLSLETVGYVINALKKWGIKVCCITDSNRIKEKEKYMYMCEKSMDTCIKVEPDLESVSEITKIKDRQLLEKHLDSANKNLRIIERAVAFKKRIEKDLTDEQIIKLYNSFNKNTVIRCLILAYRCVFSFKNEEPVFENDVLGHQNEEYSINKSIFGENIALELHHIFFESNENFGLYSLTKTLITAIINYDPTIITDELIDEKENNFLYKNDYFLLNDKGKKDYIKKFFDELDDMDFDKKRSLDILRDILKLCDPKNVEKKIDKIVSSVLKNPDACKQLEDDRLMFKNEESAMEKLFYEKLHNALNYKKMDSFEKTVKNYFKEKNYKELIDIFYKVTDNDKKQLIDLLSKNEFMIPDLSKTISRDAWTYTHEVAKFAALNKKQAEFIKMLEDKCKKSNSKSLRERCNAIVKYRFNMEKDFFKDIPIKK